VVPGSHRAGRVDHNVDKSGQSLLTSGLQIDAPDDDTLRSMELEPGQMSMHDGFIVHGSDANTGEEPRIGIAFVFIPATARQTGDAHGGVMLMRGQDSAGFFPLAGPPVDDDTMLDRARTAFEHYRDGRKAY
jgi:ectoine hydroxylase-related dioxygenase (phytanoyl-CoA dioxygenase family)